jgi:hypothetical protein
MKCEEVEIKMIDYLENTLDESNHEAIVKHLETCERCLDEITEIQQLMKQISNEELIGPDESLRINFYHMLHNEIKKTEDKRVSNINALRIPWYNNSTSRIAAGLALLVCGTFLGLIIHSGIISSHNRVELAQLHSEVAALKQTAMFTMLKEESSSDRLQAVNYVNDIQNPDKQVIDVLVQTLNHDKNVNVRLASAYALAKFANEQIVCDSLVKSLTQQDDPILQVTLINILVERREKSALSPIRQIIANKSTLKEVKAVAEKGVSSLL